MAQTFLGHANTTYKMSRGEAQFLFS